MKRIGITGTIASGKTTVSILLRRRGLAVFNSDNYAKMALHRGNPCQEKIIAIIGSDVLDENGDIVPARMADIIFMDPPFLTHAETEIIPLIMEHNLLKENGIIVVECNEDAGFDFLERLNLEIYKEKNYKSCRHVFIKVKENAI